MNQLNNKEINEEHPFFIIFVTVEFGRELFIWKEITKERYTSDEDILDLIKGILSRHKCIGFSFVRYINDKLEHPCSVSCINTPPSEDHLFEFARDVFVLVH